MARNFGFAMHALAEQNRHFGDMKARLHRVIQHFNLERIPIGMNAIQINPFQHFAPIAAKPGGLSPDRQHKKRCRVNIGEFAQKQSSKRPAFDANAVEVAAADD